MSLRERQKAQTREHLLETAGQLFGEKGYAATTIDDIIGAAGTSRATVYAYFEGKDALLAAIIERMWRDGLGFYEDFGALQDWSRESVLGWVRRFAEAYQRDSARNRAAVLAAPVSFYEAPDRHRQMVAAVRANGALWSHFPEPVADLRAGMVVNAVESQLTEYFAHNHSALSVDEFTGYLADAVRALLDAGTHPS